VCVCVCDVSDMCRYGFVCMVEMCVWVICECVCLGDM
jgi:hypothetical protein